MGNLYNKTNAPYLIAGTLATLALLASGTLAVAPYVAFLSPIAAFNVALPVALSLSILSTLILALSCKMISKNRKMEAERNKFAEKEQELKQQFESKVQELENKIALGEKAKEAVNKEVKNQSNRLTREKQDLESEVKKLNDEKEQLKAGNKNTLDKLQKEKAESEQKIKGLEGKVEGLNKEVNRLRGQQATTEQQLDQKTQGLAAKTQELGDECEEKEQLRMQLETKEKKIEELEDKSEKTGKLLGEKVTEILGLKSEIENLRVKIGEITKEKENLSGELHNEKVYINELLDGLDRIQKGCDSKVKKLQDLLFDESSNRELLEKGLLEEKKSVAQQIIEYMTNKVNEVEELTKKNEEMGDLERRAVLFATRFVKHKVLEEIDEQYLSRNDTTSSEHSSEFEGTGKSEFTNGQFSKPKLPYTSTPRTASTQEFPDFLISPIAESTQTNAIGNSTSGELGQSVLKLQNERKSPKKNKRRSSNENKENSGPQNQKSPNASFSNSKISPFKNRTNNLG